MGHGVGGGLQVMRVGAEFAGDAAQVHRQASECQRDQQGGAHHQVAVKNGHGANAFHIGVEFLAKAPLVLGQGPEHGVAGGYGAIHQVGEGVVLAAFADEGHVGLAFFPEGIEQLGERAHGLAIFGGRVLVHQLAQQPSEQGFFCGDVGQGFIALLGVARQDTVAQLQRGSGDVELHVRDGQERGHVVVVDVGGVLRHAAHGHPDGGRKSDE